MEENDHGLMQATNLIFLYRAWGNLQNEKEIWTVSFPVETWTCDLVNVK